MGAWGHLAFDNDTANDWAYGLDGVADLSLVEVAFDRLEEVGDGYLHEDIACKALAACEVLVRCLGHAGYENAYTAKVDTWVTKHPQTPSTALVRRASASIERILGSASELRELRAEDAAWREAVDDLRRRLGFDDGGSAA